MQEGKEVRRMTRSELSNVLGEYVRTISEKGVTAPAACVEGLPEIVRILLEYHLLDKDPGA